MSDVFGNLGLDDNLDHGEDKNAKGLNGMFDTAAAARAFMRAGNATVTLVSKKTGARFTYRVSEARDKETGKRTGDGTLFVGVLRGADNTSDYGYLGRISRDVFWQGRKYPKADDISANAPSALAFAWAWRKLASGDMPEALEIWHEGKCGRCGRKLTVPSSIASGFGPECIGKIG
jgi:Family of unknown function (DUF6011)